MCVQSLLTKENPYSLTRLYYWYSTIYCKTNSTCLPSAYNKEVQVLLKILQAKVILGFEDQEF